MLINGTTLGSHHLLETGLQLKDSLHRVLRINGALPHLPCSPLQVLDFALRLYTLSVSSELIWGRIHWPFKFDKLLCPE